ncbi:MAG: FHA domain-containing protein, partial [Myxococcales bacterium]|nr:FHA domain-containing protein [Myxococcales bacterium]
MSPGRDKPASSEMTTQIDLGSTSSARNDDRAYLMVRRGDGAEVHTVAEGDTLTLGRDEDADIVIDDSKASRKHVELTLEEGRLSVKD